MKEISLTQGKVALVGDEDYEELNASKWCAVKRKGGWYAMGRTGILMHRVILEAPPGVQVDHRNHDGLDNRRKNIRLCTSSQNNANRIKKPGCSSTYKGCSWCKARRKWQAYIYVNYKRIFLGYFAKEIEAARAYGQAALEYFGDFAFQQEIPQEVEQGGSPLRASTVGGSS